VCPFATERDFDGGYYLEGLFLHVPVKDIWPVVTPTAAIRKFLGMSEVGKKPQALSKALGHEVVASAILMGSLAMVIEPVRAAGYTCLVWILLLAEMAWRDKTWKPMDDRSQTQYIRMMISAIFASGFLLSSS
jgi:hypothetical protein